MPDARVESVEAIRAMRVAVVKFAEQVNLALMDADGDALRTMTWLENEARVRWTAELKRRTFDKSRAEEALRQKKLFKDPSGARQSFIDEEKALQRAKARLEEAELKLANVKKWVQRLQRELVLYKGAVGPLSTSMQTLVPVAIERLGQHVRTLDQYVALAAPDPVQSTADTSVGGGGMARARADEGGGDWRVGYDVRALRVKAETLRAKAETLRAKAAGAAAAGERPAVGLAAADAQALPHVPGVTDGADAAGAIFIAEGTGAAKRLMLERVPSAAGDSGWAIAPLDVDAARAGVGRGDVADLLTDRPDLGDILRLPAGTVVIIDAGGVVAVYDASGRDVWPAAVAAAKA